MLWPPTPLVNCSLHHIFSFYVYSKRNGQRYAQAAFYPWERPDTHCTGGWVGPRAGLDRCGKSRLPPGFDPRTVQLVASRYTDYATRPTISHKDGSKIPRFRVTARYMLMPTVLLR
jgi:hypothetical protein